MRCQDDLERQLLMESRMVVSDRAGGHGDRRQRLVMKSREVDGASSHHCLDRAETTISIRFQSPRFARPRPTLPFGGLPPAYLNFNNLAWPSIYTATMTMRRGEEVACEAATQCPSRRRSFGELRTRRPTSHDRGRR